MKKLIAGIMCFMALVSCAWAQQTMTAHDAFKASVKASGKTSLAIRGGNTVRFEPIVENDNQEVVNIDPSEMAVKVWFTDAQGNPYNPTKHRFNPKERFSIWLQASCPVTVAIFQNYLTDRPESRLVYPIKGKAVTYQPLQANVPVRIPIDFQMDDDMRDEIMSIVFAKTNLNIPAVNEALMQNAEIDVIAQSGSVVNVVAQDGNDNAAMVNINDGDELLYRCLGQFNRRVYAAQKTCFRFTPCDSNVITASNGQEVAYPEDVCKVLFANSALAQYQITMHK